MKDAILEILNKYNAVHGSPKPGHSSYCKLTGYAINGVTGVITVSTVEKNFGRESSSKIAFAAFKNLVAWQEAHCV